MARLYIAQGPGAGRTIPTTEGGVVVGRQRDAQVMLDTAAVSRRHARISWEGDLIFVEDLGSSNGTFINDIRISARTQLRPGDTLRIGTSLFRLEAEAMPEHDMTIHRQTVAATSNSELFRDNSGQKLQAVLQLAHHLGRSVDADALLKRLLEQLLVLSPEADRALVLMRDGEEPSVRAVKNRSDRPAAGPLFSRTVLRKVFTQGVGVLASDTRMEQSYLANMTLNALGIQSLVCVPLQTHAGKVFGAVQLDRFQTGKPFTQDDLYLLTAVALMVSTVLENAQMYQELLAAERMQRDLAMAREIQLGYLPTQSVHLSAGPVDLAAVLHPALEVSGDFYDYFALDDHRLAFAVADVSGKGMAAALFMTLVHALERHLAQEVASPADLIAGLNDAIALDNPNFMFVTLCFGIYDHALGQVTVAHGGHPPMLVRRSDGRVEEIAIQGAPLLGMQSPIRRSAEAVIQLAPGDAILLYTDGVTESPGLSNPNELYGPKRLAEALQALPSQGSLADWVAELRRSVAAFSGSGPLADDITLLALRRSQD